MYETAYPAVVAQAVELEVRGVVVGLLEENCWIIGSRHRGEACVVDPGDEPEEILALARDMGVKITRIVASHAHFDHIMAAGDVKAATGAPFLMHPADQAIADALPRVARQWLGTDVAPAPPADAPLAHGDDLEIAGCAIRVLHTPGHTPGSVCLYVPEARLLFSGDTLFRGSIGRTDLTGGDPRRIMASLANELMALPNDVRVLPGHMAETTIGAERATNPFVAEALRTRQESS